MTAYIAAGLPQQALTEFVSDLKKDLDHIILTVSKELNIPVEKIFKKTRKREIVEARQISMCLIKRRTNVTLKAIGRKFCQDHSTVIYAIETVNDLCETNRYFKSKVERIEEAI